MVKKTTSTIKRYHMPEKMGRPTICWETPVVNILSMPQAKLPQEPSSTAAAPVIRSYPADMITAVARP